MSIDFKKLNSEQKKKLQRIAQVVDGGNISIVEYLFQIEEQLPTIINLLNKVKGDKGDNYVLTDFDKAEIAKKIKAIPGDPGENYILTPADKIEIAKKIKPTVIDRVIEKHTEIIVKEVPVITETIIKEPIPLHTSPQEVRDLLEILTGDERLDASAIKNFEIAIKAYLQLNPPNGPMLHPVALGNLPDVNTVGATIGQVLAFNGIYWAPVNQGSGGSGYQAPLTGGLTGTNTWTTAPNVLVIDGVPRQKVQTDGTIMWIGTTTTILTVNCPKPTFDIFSPS